MIAQKSNGKPFIKMQRYAFMQVDEKALDLLDKMLVYDPKQRYTAE